MRRSARREVILATGAAGAALVGATGCLARPDVGPTNFSVAEPATGGVAAPPVRLVVFPDDGIGQLLQLIESAVRQLDLYVFELDSSEIERRVIEVARRGVRVRAIVEPNPSGRVQQANQTMSRLRRAGAQVKPAGRPFSKTHAKTLIVDGAQAWVGTGNLVDAWRERRDYAVITRQPETVRALAGIFDSDWLGASSAVPITPARGAIDPRTRVVASPQNGRSAITAFLMGARWSLYLEHDQLEDPAILDVLAKRSRAGLDVRVVLSESDEGQRTMRGLQLRSPSMQVRLLAQPRVHAKLAIADEERMLLGSHNLTKESLESRREVSVIVDDAQAVGTVLGVFRRDFEGVAEAGLGGAPAAVVTAPGRPFMWGFMAGMVAPGVAALAWALGRR